jgi:hypothetical protein
MVIVAIASIPSILNPERKIKMKFTSHPRSIKLMHFLCATVASTIFLVGCVRVPARTGQINVPNAGLGQPGYYGRLDTRSYPQPQVLYRQPVIVNRGAMVRPPIYMRVPPNHYNDWYKHCHDYNACGERVYFVQDNWYNREYAPRYQKQYGNSWNNRRGKHN